jgi:2-polyprenyl-6-methoxyphenol hydroxylase-like FAD-dependent oxidoreductase
VFGPEAGFEVSLGYHVAAFEIEGYRPRDELVAVSHAAPGRQILRLSLRDDMTLFLFVFRDEYLTAESPSSEQECKSVLTDVFTDVGWECPQILAAMEGVRGVYFDRASQIRMDRWTKGRTALIGDAACVSLVAGEGTGLAMAEAYVLAGELLDCGGDHVAAFARNHVSRLLRIPFIADFFIGRNPPALPASGPSANSLAAHRRANGATQARPGANRRRTLGSGRRHCFQ